jgi:hypothetical protein
LKTVRRSLRGFFDRPSLPRLGSVAKYHDKKPTGADKGEAQGLEEAPAENDPAADAAVAEDVEEHVGDADGKAKRKRGVTIVLG